MTRSAVVKIVNAYSSGARDGFDGIEVKRFERTDQKIAYSLGLEAGRIARSEAEKIRLEEQ